MNTDISNLWRQKDISKEIENKNNRIREIDRIRKEIIDEQMKCVRPAVITIFLGLILALAFTSISLLIITLIISAFFFYKDYRIGKDNNSSELWKEKMYLEKEISQLKSEYDRCTPGMELVKIKAQAKQLEKDRERTRAKKDCGHIVQKALIGGIIAGDVGAAIGAMNAIEENKNHGDK